MKPKSFLSLSCKIIIILNLACFRSVAQVPVPSTTAFTRGFLKTTSQATAQAYIGASSGGATNGIEQSNGRGTNTTLVTPTLTGNVTFINNITNLGAFGTSTPSQQTTNLVYYYGVQSANFNGMYIWNSGTSTYTNPSSGSYIFFQLVDPNTGGPTWTLTNVSSTLWDNFVTTVPIVLGQPGGSVPNFPFIPQFNGNIVYAFGSGNQVGFFGITNTASVTNYIVQATSSNVVLSVTNPMTISGSSPILSVGNSNSFSIGLPNFGVYNPLVILGAFNCSEQGYNSGMVGGHDNTNYGLGNFIGGSAFCTVYPNTGEDCVLGCELSRFNNAQGVAGGLWCLNCTNNVGTAGGLIASISSTLNSSNNNGNENVLMLACSVSYSDVGSGLLSGSHNTNYGSGPVFVFGDNLFSTNVSNIEMIGENLSVTNATNSQTFGNGLTNTGNGNVMVGTTNSYIIFTNGGVKFNNPTNALSFVPTQTNWISGLLYTNLTGRPIGVQAGSAMANAVTGVGSFAQMQLIITSIRTNVVAVGYGALTAGANANLMIEGYVPAGNTFIFTNTSGGTGNTATLTGGQYITY